MIASYRSGLRLTVSEHQHRNELVLRRINAYEAHAKKQARKMARVVKNQLEARIVDFTFATQDNVLRAMAVKYGVVKPLIPLTIAQTLKLLSAQQ